MHRGPTCIRRDCQPRTCRVAKIDTLEKGGPELRRSWLCLALNPYYTSCTAVFLLHSQQACTPCRRRDPPTHTPRSGPMPCQTRSTGKSGAAGAGVRCARYASGRQQATHRPSRFGMSAHSGGTAPVKLLKDRSKASRDGRLPQAGGRLPCKSFPRRSSPRSFFSFDQSAGSTPAPNAISRHESGLIVPAQRRSSPRSSFSSQPRRRAARLRKANTSRATWGKARKGGPFPFRPKHHVKFRG